MKFKLSAIIGLTALLAVAFSFQNATAYDPDWKEHQKELFEKVGLKPGEHIDENNWEKCEALLPSQMVEWVKKGWMDITVGEYKFDPSPDKKWAEDSKKNAGKYKLDDTKNLVDAVTGKPPKYTYGELFPNVDIKNDPDGPTKVMYNRSVALNRMGNYRQGSTIEWVGNKGFERVIEFKLYKYYFWSRPDGEQPNKKGLRYTDIIAVVRPFDLAGTAQLTIRKLDGTKDDLYVYVPAIRRVKRMSGANRSDPFMGSDFTSDDSNSWAGLTNSMTWKYVGTQTALFCLVDWALETTNDMVPHSDGSWSDPPNLKQGGQVGYEVEGWKRKPWAPATNARFVPRTFNVIEATPVDPFYNYGKVYFWQDQDTHFTNYKIYFDKAGEYWKSSIYYAFFFTWGDPYKKKMQGSNVHVFYDEKTEHATILHSNGKFFGRPIITEYQVPMVNQKLFTVNRLRTLTK